LRTLLLALSRSATLRRLLERSRLGRRLSSRFVAGLELSDALAAVRALAAGRLAATLDHLGENVTSEAEAGRAAAAAGESLDAVPPELDCHVAVKLTQFGLNLPGGAGERIAIANLARVAEVASKHRRFVGVDMEESRHTDATLGAVRAVHARGLPIGVAIQSYLHRSEEDVRALCAAGIGVRLVKGAYREPAEIAYQKKADVDASFIRLTGLLLESGVYHAIATHDPRMIAAALAHVRRLALKPERFEFQMLYGIRQDLQRQLRSQGWRVRVYVPYGAEWYPYFMRRLAERPANLVFLLRNIVKS
jgi:proline dehydrogenase